MAKTKIFRSLIKKYFPTELLIELHRLTQVTSVSNNNKTPRIIDLLNQYKVPFTPLGNGTNRYGILIDGYAVKIALDGDGMIDNKREFKYTKTLQPYVVKVYECASTGLIAVTEYVTIFTIDDMYEHVEDMRDILQEIGSRFLVGDIGVSSQNYVNWGIRTSGEIVILDFAYIYALSFKGYECKNCDSHAQLEYDVDFNYLVCPECRHKYEFRDIRRQMTKEDQAKEIGDIRSFSYQISEPEEELEVEDSKTELTDKELKEKKKREKKLKKKQKEEAKKEKDIDELSESELMKKIEYLDSLTIEDDKENEDNGKEEETSKRTRRNKHGRNEKKFRIS